MQANCNEKIQGRILGMPEIQDIKQFLKNKWNYILNFQPLDKIEIFYTLTFDTFYFSINTEKTEQSWFPDGLGKETSTNCQFAIKTEYITMGKLFQEEIHKFYKKRKMYLWWPWYQFYPYSNKKQVWEMKRTLICSQTDFGLCSERNWVSETQRKHFD